MLSKILRYYRVNANQFERRRFVKRVINALCNEGSWNFLSAVANVCKKLQHLVWIRKQATQKDEGEGGTKTRACVWSIVFSLRKRVRNGRQDSLWRRLDRPKITCRTDVVHFVQCENSDQQRDCVRPRSLWCRGSSVRRSWTGRRTNVWGGEYELSLTLRCVYISLFPTASVRVGKLCKSSQNKRLSVIKCLLTLCITSEKASAAVPRPPVSPYSSQKEQVKVRSLWMRWTEK